MSQKSKNKTYISTISTMNYFQIMDTQIRAEIQMQLLDRFKPAPSVPTASSYIHPLPNRRTPPPQDWILRMKPRLDQQIRQFLSTLTHDNNDNNNGNDDSNNDNGNSSDNNNDNNNNNCDDGNNLSSQLQPVIIRNLTQYLDTYRQLFRPIIYLDDKYPRLIYRTAKFLATCHGLIWMLGECGYNDSEMEQDINLEWLFFIALSYAMVDNRVDNVDNSTSDGQLQTLKLFKHLDAIFNSTPYPNPISEHEHEHEHAINTNMGTNMGTNINITTPINYLEQLWQKVCVGNLDRVTAIKRALDCEKRCWQIQHYSQKNKQHIGNVISHNPNISRETVASLLLDKSISTILLMYRPRRSASIQQWRQLYWTATVIQLLDDAADASEDTRNGIAGTTSLAMCDGDLPSMMAAVLDTVSYVYYNYEIFGGTYQRLAVLHQIALYGVVKNMGGTHKFSTEWIRSSVISKLALQLETLYGVRSCKPEIAKWLLCQLISQK